MVPRVCLRVGRGGSRPFATHAWIEADGIMVGEDYPAGHSAVPSVFGVGLDVCDYEA